MHHAKKRTRTRLTLNKKTLRCLSSKVGRQRVGDDSQNSCIRAHCQDTN